MKDRLNKSLFLIIPLFIIIIYFPYFLGLGDLPIRTWDESRLVANALEMNDNGNYLVTSYNGKPDMWNTKPPLMIWSQVVSLRMFGNEELSFRIPSAIAGFLTCLLLLFFSLKYLKSSIPGFIATLIMITSEGHLGYHVARTGDYDAMLTLFMMAYLLFFFLWTETGKLKYLHLFFASVILAVYTKSIQGLLFIPPIFIYILVTGHFMKTVREKWLYIDTLITIAIIGAYYLARESVNPGYLEAVWENELGGRMLETIENHTGPASYYLDLLWNKQFPMYLPAAMVGIITWWLFPQSPLKKVLGYSIITAIMYLITISVAKTKLEWYTAPVIPVLAIIASMPFLFILQLITDEKTGIKNVNRSIASTLFIAMFFTYPYARIVDEVYKQKEKPESMGFYRFTHFMKNAAEGQIDLNNHKIVYLRSRTQLDYYMRKMHEKGVKVFYLNPQWIKPGDKIVYDNEDEVADLKKKYYTSEIQNYDGIKVMQLDSLKIN